ncbi:lytic transglycosylase domain-containing protein [Mucilaginibacter ginkgonis]|uniref:Transglycosylase SLT domain-containing protein n=1 Tax=Mucilaginibacter ginkgonis TaxID=2682091 RepID=A0A6I4INL0_9SPHI|nr:lytic transglycosylase domain-containing protein [Mucilaginibacter ginkgonis]QQL48786.1 transglycosylase SLT domain-containing protein [Mucilaginibacter ginkgonis]
MRVFTVVAFLLAPCLGFAASGNSKLTDSVGTKDYHSTHFHRDTLSVQPSGMQLTTMRGKLQAIQKEVPLDYNDFVQNYIDLYTGPNRREEMGRVLGLAKYYFPIYEKAFRDAGIPEEIKFLSIVESALNPNAISRVGAAGPWQFMSTTGRTYGLNINNYVDERRDPIAASYAAAAYLKDAYQEFGDWLLAIASYNCGKSSVERAVAKANALDYWSIRQYLPVETRGYVPAYIAVIYVMNYYNKHNITPQACSMPMQTDTILVNKFVSLGNISRVIAVDPNQLALLNPGYLQRVVNGTAAAPRRLVIPQIQKERYSALYDALNGNQLTVAAMPVIATADNAGRVEDIPAFHTVKAGETLAGIADKFGVELSDLKSWNKVGERAIPGQTLRLIAPGTVALASPKNGSVAVAAGL